MNSKYGRVLNGSKPNTIISLVFVIQLTQTMRAIMRNLPLQPTLVQRQRTCARTLSQEERHTAPTLARCD